MIYSHIYKLTAWLKQLPTLLGIGLVRFYRLCISPWQPNSCRFVPSCSAYAITALQTHGLLRGIGLAIWRILRCHPWTTGGLDEVPPRHHHAKGDCNATHK